MIPDGAGNYYVVAVIREESQIAPLVPKSKVVMAGRCRGVEDVYPKGAKRTAMSAAIVTAEDVSPKPVKKIAPSEPKPSGRGRPAVPEHLKRVRAAGRYRLPQWLMDWLQKEGDAGRKIKRALIAQYGLKPPEERL